MRERRRVSGRRRCLLAQGETMKSLLTIILLAVLWLAISFPCRATAEELIIVTTQVTPSCGAPPCYYKYETYQLAEDLAKQRFVIMRGTPIARCEVENHRWVDDPIRFYNQPGMHCLFCGISRNIKRVQKKREVTDTEDIWEDDGSRVEKRNNPWSPMTITTEGHINQ